MGPSNHTEKAARPPGRRSSSHDEEPPLEDGDNSAVSPSHHSPQSRSPPQPPSPVGGAVQLRLATWSLLTFATFWGVLARLGLIWIGGFAERDVFASVWPQMVGCLVMGFVTERKKMFESMSVYESTTSARGGRFCHTITNEGR